MTMRRFALTLLLGAATALQGCAGAPGVAGSTSNAKLVQGPPIADIVTHLCAISAEHVPAKGKPGFARAGTSLMGKFADLKGLMPKKTAKS